MARSKPAYTPCRIFYDVSDGCEVSIGHFLKSTGGSVYRVQDLRRDKHRKERLHLTCLRWPENEIPKRAKVHPLHWYPRKKRTTTLADL
jgi:hypothetical protein